MERSKPVERLDQIERLIRLEEWQRSQAASLTRLEQEYDERLTAIESKIDRMTWWLVLTLGGTLATLAIKLVERGG